MITSSRTARPAFEVVPDPGPEATERSVWHAARAWAWLQASDPSREGTLTRERTADWRMLALAEWELMLTWVAIEGERTAREVAGLISAAQTQPEFVELHIRRCLEAAGISPAEILPAGVQAAGAAVWRMCRGCGCTEDAACFLSDQPCYWVEIDLCSACTQ